MAATEPAADRDVVGGVRAKQVAYPTGTEEAAALLAADQDQAVVVRGAGTKIDWGMPPGRLDLIIDTSRMTGVVEHAAGDLITVVRAGTPLSDLDLPGQQLALESPIPGATVGGTLATNLSGPRRTLYGTARDLLIGITVVRPDGTVAHAGGKVVKNVAGYDLGKLFIGSYGTLGLITECVFRLHPRPASAAVVRTVAPSVAEAGRLVAAVLAAQVVPSAIEVNAAPTGDPVEVAVMVEGSAPGVRDRATLLAKLLGDAEEGAPPWWGRLPFEAGDVGLKLTAPLSGVPALLAAARETGAPLTVRGSAGSGVLHAGLPGTGAGEAARVVEFLRAAAIRAGGHAVVLTAPPAVRQTVDMWGPVGGLALMRRVKDQFDPARRFAPGRFVGGI
jgi:glycolate oxidase FAD binding subunit